MTYFSTVILFTEYASKKHLSIIKNKINNNENYAKVEAPRLIEDVENGTEVMLVDHANFKESVSNMKLTLLINHLIQEKQV